MELTRNHYFGVGIVILFLGIQVQMIDDYVLTEQATTFLAKHVKKIDTEQPQSLGTFLAASGPRPILKKTLTPPTWAGWALISVGSVLVLHSLALPKPAG